MNTLLIAPTAPDLPFQPVEVERLVNILGAKLRSGRVQCSSVFDAIEEYRPELLWFSAHGSEDGIHMDDCIIDGDMLSSAVRGTPVRLIYLNSCESRATAERIYGATGCHVIATISEIDDRHAFVTAQRFAALIAAGESAIGAYEKAKTPDLVYVPMINANGNGYEGLRRLVAEQQIKIDSLERMVDEMRANGVRNEMRFESLQASLNRRFQQMQTSQWVVAGLVVVLLILQLSQVLQ